MKLHLPKILLTAVVAGAACFSQSWGAEYTVVKASNSSDLASATFSINGDEQMEFSNGAWKNFSDIAADGNASSSPKVRRDHTLHLTASTHTGDDFSFNINFSNFNAGAIVVDSGAKTSGITGGSRTFYIGKDGGSYASTFNRNFTISPGTALYLEGTQTWTIADSKAVTLSTPSINVNGDVKFDGGSINAVGANINIGAGKTLEVNSALSVNKTITNSGTLKLGTNGSITVSSLAGMARTALESSVWQNATENKLFNSTYALYSGGAGEGEITVNCGSQKGIKVTDGSFEYADFYAVASDTTLADIKAAAPATAYIGIQDGKTVTHSTNTTFDVTVKVQGSGYYRIAPGDATTAVNLTNDGWTGTVQLFDNGGTTSTNLNLHGLSNANSTVELKNASGYWTADAMNGTLRLTKSTKEDVEQAAWTITNGGSNPDDANKIMGTFAGAVKGDGMLKFAWNVAAGTNTGYTGYKFTGDVSSWNGSFVYDGSGEKIQKFNLVFGGAATDVYATISRTGDNGELRLKTETAGGVTFHKDVHVDTVNATTSVKLVGNMETDAFTLDVGASLTLAGGSLNVNSAIALSSLTVDYSKYSTDKTHTLVTASDIDGGFASVAGSYVSGDSVYSTSISLVEGNSDMIQLTYTREGDSSITTTVTGWELNGTALTLNVDAYLCEGMAVNLKLLDEDVKNAILAKLGQVEGDPMVSITLQGSNEGGIITADKLNEVVFVKGDTGQNYWGEMVDGVGLMYNVERIPEPASATLSLAALMMLCARRRRRA